MSMHLKGSSDMIRSGDEGWWTSRTGLEQKLIILSTVLFIVAFAMTITTIVYKNKGHGEAYATCVMSPQATVSYTGLPSDKLLGNLLPPKDVPRQAKELQRTAERDRMSAIFAPNHILPMSFAGGQREELRMKVMDHFPASTPTVPPPTVPPPTTSPVTGETSSTSVTGDISTVTGSTTSPITETPPTTTPETTPSPESTTTPEATTTPEPTTTPKTPPPTAVIATTPPPTPKEGAAPLEKTSKLMALLKESNRVIDVMEKQKLQGA